MYGKKIYYYLDNISYHIFFIQERVGSYVLDLLSGSNESRQYLDIFFGQTQSSYIFQFFFSPFKRS